MLYTRHTAEGNFDFTSISKHKPDVIDIKSDDDDDAGEKDDDLQLMDQPEVEQGTVNHKKDEVEEEINERLRWSM
jgi:hypothetical protein